MVKIGLDAGHGIYVKGKQTPDGIKEFELNDKVCDKISDKILDSALEVDPDSRMAVEATIKDDFVLLYGEAKTNAELNYEEIARWVLKDIGYNEEYNVLVKVSKHRYAIKDCINSNSDLILPCGIYGLWEDE